MPRSGAWTRSKPTDGAVVVVGGGIIGAATSYALTHHPKWTADDRLVLLEAVELANGASGKAGGLLSRDWHSYPTDSLGEASFKLHAELAQAHGGGAEWGYRRLDVLSVSLNPSAKRKGKAPPLSWLGPAVTKSSTLGSKGDMAQVHPRLLTRKLVEVRL